VLDCLFHCHREADRHAHILAGKATASAKVPHASAASSPFRNWADEERNIIITCAPVSIERTHCTEWIDGFGAADGCAQHDQHCRKGHRDLRGGRCWERRGRVGRPSHLCVCLSTAGAGKRVTAWYIVGLARLLYCEHDGHRRSIHSRFLLTHRTRQVALRLLCHAHAKAQTPLKCMQAHPPTRLRLCHLARTPAHPTHAMSYGSPQEGGTSRAP
jgi:hypothetical protein